MRNWQIIIVIGCIFSIFSIGCRYNKCLSCERAQKQKRKGKHTLTEKDKAKIVEARKKRLRTLREQLQLTPLFEKWHHSFSQERLKKLYVAEDILFVETERKTIFAFNRQNGVPLWVYTLGDPLDFPPEIYEDKIYLLSMSVFHVLDKKTGELLWKKHLKFVPCSPPMITRNYIYLGGWDNFLYTLERNTGDKAWRYRIDGHIWGKPAVTPEGMLFMASTDERIYAIRSHNGYTIKNWAEEGRYTTLGPNVVGPVIQENPPVLYIGSRDYNLYSLSIRRGELRWKFESGGEINHRPYLVGNHLYVISDRDLGKDSVLYLLESDTGHVKWSLNHAKQILFFGRKHDWILTHERRVAAVNSKTGEVRNYFDVSSWNIFATNIADNLGYMATQDGFVFAVEER